MLGGYSLAHAMMMMIPEAWAGNPLMDEERRAFYEYHAALMEPWDGPAAMAFTDGRQIGATLDRNGLRPARYLVTDDELVIHGLGVGRAADPGRKNRHEMAAAARQDAADRSRTGPHRRRRRDQERLAKHHPYKEWLANTQILLEDLKPARPRAARTDVPLLDRQQAFGYTQEDSAILMAPMAVTGQEAIGSMGADTPLSALSTSRNRSTPTSSRSSRRSPTRRSTRSARRW